MNLNEVIERLRAAEPLLRARGIRHAGIFGSAARRDGDADSDIDILIEFDAEAVVTIFDYAGIRDSLAGLLDRPVDVVESRSLKSHLRPSVERDLVRAF